MPFSNNSNKFLEKKRLNLLYFLVLKTNCKAATILKTHLHLRAQGTDNMRNFILFGSHANIF